MSTPATDFSYVMMSNAQKSIRVPIRALGNFYVCAMKAVRLPPEAASVRFVTSAQIRKWNAAYRGKNQATDVLSFPADPEASKEPDAKLRPKRSGSGSSRCLSCYLGDIAIAPAEAKKYARRHGRSFEHELSVLILHGILHLMGYDHETDTGQMDRREQRLRRRLGIG